HESIEKGVVFRGTNLWILVFAIFIASVGLNMNSPAVIIGAMLISPLMGPINGIGYSVATYDFDLLKKSLKNYAFAGVGGLITSTLYFVITPIHTEHSELLARTSPTIFDVFIAIFGGLAGIVAISSKNKGNVIPGVAIATALMPPLCTAGYGLSIGNWNYFMGALYLFAINTVFIALSVMLVSQLLKFPKKTFLLSREIKNTNIVVIIVILATVLPSVYLGITLVQKEKFNSKAKRFVQKVGVWEGNYLLDDRINPDNRTVTLVYGGNEFTEHEEELLREKAKDMGLNKAKIGIERGLKIGDNEELALRDDEVNKMNAKVNRLSAALDAKTKEVDSLRAALPTSNELLKEIQVIYPTLTSCMSSETMKYIDSLKQSVPYSMVYFTCGEEMEEVDKEKIRLWLERRLERKEIVLKF
ncbi:MAG: DUF389 domain-containing protein, partial [Crocinitomicaceae bacterium]|nr:DUF389 domain-containing protein [Crocinitomicaceae bacterium]